MFRRSVPRGLRLAANNTEVATGQGGRSQASLALVAASALSAASGPAVRPPPRTIRRVRAALARSTAGHQVDAAERHRRGGVRTGALALAIVLCAVVAGWSYNARAREAAAEQAAREGLRAAVSAAEVILSYDHRRIDADIAAARARTTGAFRTQYADTAKTVAPMAKQYQAIVQASVKEGSVVRADPQKVVTLIFVDQSTRSTRVTGTKIDQARVRMTMVRAGGEWRVAEVEAL